MCNRDRQRRQSPRRLTARELAAQKGLTIRAVQRACAAGELAAASKIQGRWLIPQQSAAAFPPPRDRRTRRICYVCQQRQRVLGGVCWVGRAGFGLFVCGVCWRRTIGDVRRQLEEARYHLGRDTV